ncbi:NAD(P)H-dependent oxidoreductase [Roseateles sp.]|uniref:NADPH-dependent FMN reductase n=1 Tax=Roseateles sp. TaxID=1971397 RepID=UPI0031E40013
MTIKILAFSGSSRRGSLNQQLLAIAAAGADAAGADVTMLRLADLNLPLYDGDLEAAAGLPAGALDFKRLLASHDALLIATPEHNGAVTALLKNALDWASRPAPQERPGTSSFSHLCAAMVSASPGLLAGIRSQVSLQIVLNKLGVAIVPASFALPAAHQAFDERGALKDAGADKAVRAVGSALVRAAVRDAPANS